MTQGIILILGAGSDVGVRTAHYFAQKGYAIQLAARKPSELERDCCDIQMRYSVSATAHKFDALEVSSHHKFVNDLAKLPDIVICCVGYMGQQSESETCSEAALLVLRSNFEGPASILSEIANQFERRGSGTIVGISSVAGARGRRSNYIYGSAKAGFTSFLSGLRNRLFGSGVHVVTVVPGFIDTKMTKGLSLPARLTAKPEDLADAIYVAIQNKKDIIYVKPIWCAIMLIIQAIPEKLFKRMNI